MFKEKRNGYAVKSYTTHFIDRVIGQVSESHSNKRLGVSIEDVADCLLNPQKISDIYERIVERDGQSFVDKRVNFASDRCSVAFSITENRIIQTSPKKRDKAVVKLTRKDN